jgi:hypothetical protein
VSTLGWLTTLFYLWRRRDAGAKEPLIPADNTSEKHAFKKLVTACANGDPAGARAAVIAWANAFKPDAPAVSLEQVARQFGDEEFAREVKQLDARLYSPDQGNWAGSSLADCARRLRGGDRHATKSDTEELRLYPGANSC